MVRGNVRRFAMAAMLLPGVMAASIAHAQKEEFVVGGVLSLSGPLALAGEAMKKGVDLAVEMRGGKVLGVPVRVRWEDDEGKPQATLQKATKLDADGAQILFGAVTSATTTSMLKLAERRKIPPARDLCGERRDHRQGRQPLGISDVQFGRHGYPHDGRVRGRQ